MAKIEVTPETLAAMIQSAVNAALANAQGRSYGHVQSR